MLEDGVLGTRLGQVRDRDERTYASSIAMESGGDAEFSAANMTAAVPR